ITWPSGNQFECFSTVWAEAAQASGSKAAPSRARRNRNKGFTVCLLDLWGLGDSVCERPAAGFNEPGGTPAVKAAHSAAAASASCAAPAQLHFPFARCSRRAVPGKLWPFPQPLPTMQPNTRQDALAGLKVVDFTIVMSGPMCT